MAPIGSPVVVDPDISINDVTLGATTNAAATVDAALGIINDVATSSTTTNFWLYVGIGCGAAALTLLLLLLICITCLCCCCCKNKKKKVDDEAIGLIDTNPSSKSEDKEGKRQRDKERKAQERQEVGDAVQTIRQFGDEREEQYFIQDKRLPELGSRLQKHWFRGHYRDSSEVIVTEAPLTKHCRLTLNSDTLYTINSILLPNMSQHPYVHPIHEIHYTMIFQKDKVLTVQPLVAMGSLRDYIFKDNPLHDWSKKYTKLAQKLPVDKVSLFGKQVLEAINFLHKQGFPCLGHVHTGNIYVVSPDHCKLGGYDNTLLGYRTRLYRMCEQHGYAKAIDVVMFGHVMYEMGSGCELEGVVPSLAQDGMAKMEDSITDIVNFIFEQSSNGNNNLKKIVQHSFFAEGSKLKAAPQVEVHKKVKRLLEDVSKGTGKPAEMTTTLQDQDSPKTKALDKVKTFLHENSDTYDPKSLKSFPEIGRRFGKYWGQVRTIEDDRQLMVSISAVPEGSPLNWSKAQQTLDKFFTEVQHPYLHLTHQVHHVKEAHQVVLIQQMVAKGSLRDRIQSTRCLDNWTMKLQDKGYSLSVDKVALYGRQILEAVDHLYSLGFPPLGHLHTGNILVEGDVCRVGGYENTLIGHKTCQRVFAHLKHTNSIDLTMFGHVIYELSTGRELGVEFPGEGDYEMVKGKEQIIQILTFIFNTSTKVDNRSVSYQEGLKDVKLHSFFSDLRLGGDLDTNSQNIKVGVAEEVQAFLDKVRAKRKGGNVGVKKVFRKLETRISSISS